jgi:hypothetical protein
MRDRKREAVPDPQVRLERIKRRISDAEYRVEADKVAHAIVARLLVSTPAGGAGSPPRPAGARPA